MTPLFLSALISIWGPAALAEESDAQKLLRFTKANNCEFATRIIRTSTAISFVAAVGDAIKYESECIFNAAIQYLVPEPGGYMSALNQGLWATTKRKTNWRLWADKLLQAGARPSELLFTLPPHCVRHDLTDLAIFLMNRGADLDWIQRNPQGTDCGRTPRERFRQMCQVTAMALESRYGKRPTVKSDPSEPITITLYDGNLYPPTRLCKEHGEDLVCANHAPGVSKAIGKIFDLPAAQRATGEWLVCLEATTAQRRGVTINFNDRYFSSREPTSDRGWSEVNLRHHWMGRINASHLNVGRNEIVISTNDDMPHIRAVRLVPISP